MVLQPRQAQLRRHTPVLDAGEQAAAAGVLWRRFEGRKKWAALLPALAQALPLAPPQAEYTASPMYSLSFSKPDLPRPLSPPRRSASTSSSAGCMRSRRRWWWRWGTASSGASSCGTTPAR